MACCPGQTVKPAQSIPSRECLLTEVAAWESARNTLRAPIHWRFTNENARIKLTRFYPKP